MWRRWLEFVGKSSGPDRYLLLGAVGAPAYAFGGAAIGTGVVALVLVGLLVSVRLARVRGLDQYEVSDGSELCFACRGTFSIAETRTLRRYVALLGPSTWEARQHRYCERCARRQEIMVVALLVLLIGAASAASVALVHSLKGS